MRTLTTSLLVLATIAVAVLPIFGDQASKEVARWHIAAAMNAAELEIGDVEESLAKAKAWAGDDLKSLRDFWLFKVRLALNEDPDTTSEVIQEALESSKQYRSLALSASFELMRRLRFGESAQVLALAKDESWNESPTLLNQLSYMRALAAVDLDEALVDIDKAIEQEPESPGLLDTRAWVLYQMGRSVDALSDINYAIQLADRERSRDWLGRAIEGLASLNADDGAKRDEDKAKQQQKPADSSEAAEAATGQVNEPAGVANSDDGADEAAEVSSGDSSAGSSEDATAASDEAAEPGDIPMDSFDDLQADFDRYFPSWPYSIGMERSEPLGYRPLTQAEAGGLWELGVYRYHRAKILEALGRTKEATRDMDWIREHKLPPDDRLY